MILFAVGALALVSAAFTFNLAPLGRAWWSLITTLLGVVSTVGLWAMRRWGPILYLAGFLVGTITFLTWPPEAAAGLRTSVSFWATTVAVPAVYLAIVLPHWKKLT
jgi:hypothetical protein